LNRISFVIGLPLLAPVLTDLGAFGKFRVGKALAVFTVSPSVIATAT
jgi:hypothetical protein